MSNNNNIKMVTYTDGFEPYEQTNPLEVYKWVAEVMVYRHAGSKDIKRIVHHQKYDGNMYMTFYISNGTRVEVTLPR